MNKRQRKKKDQKEVQQRIMDLWNFQLKGDEPCDDFTCSSCYMQADDSLSDPYLLPQSPNGRAPVS